MVKVLLERTLKGKHVADVSRLLRQMRVLAMQQPGYISGETLHDVDDPNHYLVISTWEALDDWRAWQKNPQRVKMQDEVDRFLEAPTIIRVFTY